MAPEGWLTDIETVFIAGFFPVTWCFCHLEVYLFGPNGSFHSVWARWREWLLKQKPRHSVLCSHSAFLSFICLINLFLGLLWPVEGTVFESGPGWRIVHVRRHRSPIKLLPAERGAGGTRHTLIPPTSWPQKACWSLPSRPGSWLSPNPPCLPCSSDLRSSALTVPWVGLGFELLGTAYADFVG